MVAQRAADKKGASRVMRFLSTFVAIDKEKDSHVVPIVLNGPAYKGDPIHGSWPEIDGRKGLVSPARSQEWSSYNALRDLMASVGTMPARRDLKWSIP